MILGTESLEHMPKLIGANMIKLDNKLKLLSQTEFDSVKQQFETLEKHGEK
jgi:hypothetical protein